MSIPATRWVRAVVAAFLIGSLLALLGASSDRATAAPITYPDWPMFLQGPERSAATTDPALSTTNAQNLTLKWKYLTGGSVATSTSIVGDTAYVGSWDGSEYAINATTGALVWKTYLGQASTPNCDPQQIGITSSATVVNGTVYVGGGGPYWYALNASTGAVLWKIFTGPIPPNGGRYNWSSPLISNGAAYIGIASVCDAPLVQGKLLKIDLTTHKVVAVHNFVPNGEVGGGVWTSPTLDASTNTIFVSTGTLNDYTQTQSQAVVALDATTLAYKSSWQLPFSAAVLDSDWGTTPTLTTDANGDQLLAVANKNGILYTFDRNDLAAGPIWQQRVALGGDCPQCGDGSIASGIFVNNVLYFAGGQNVVNGHGSGGSVTAFDAGTGKVLWVRQTEQPIVGSPAYVNGMIGEVEGTTFEVVDASNGQLLYSYPLGAVAYGAVSIAHSQFYVGAADGNLYAFGLGPPPPTPPSDPNCPAGLTCRNIGDKTNGSESTSSGDLTVQAKGGAVGGTADHFRFIEKPVTGDQETSVEVLSQSPQQPRPQAGIMVRQSTAPNSPFYAIFAYPNNLNEGNPQPDVVFKYRSCFGCAMVELTKWYPAPQPVSFMLQRAGNLFSAGISFDGGTTYTLVPGSTADLDLPATTLTGLMASSSSTTTTATDTFTNLSVGAPLTTTLKPQAPDHPCPQSWTCQDIGNPSPRGDTTGSGSSYTLYGSGTGIGSASDSFHFVSQPVSGNQAISARVAAQSGAPATAQEGLMMRESNAPTAPYYAALLNPGGSTTVSWRTYDGVVQRTTLPVPSAASPVYLKIVRYGDATTTYFGTLISQDGTTWTPVLGSTVAIDMGSNGYLAGMAATSDYPRVTVPVSFTALSLTTESTPPPGICPPGFSCQDIGDQILPGNQVYLAGQCGSSPTLAVSAGGSDMWGTYDNFRFTSEPFPPSANSSNGDGTMSARVVSQTNPGGPWMKSGVMIRSGVDPSAPYYAAFVTPAHGVIVQWRPTQAAQTQQVQGPSAASAPVWLLISRYSDVIHHKVYYSAYTSSDGSTFTYVAGSEVALNLPGPLVAGLASDSYNDTRLSDVTFDNIAELGGSQAPPYVCPSSWSCADLGSPLPPGDDSLANGVWHEVGGGGDIWSTADRFHFVWQNLTGDGAVTAEVTAQQATSPWAKAGPMMRSTTGPGSPYYAVFVTPGHGVAVQWRATTAGTSQQLLTTGVLPAYLRVARYTANGQTSYTAYTSGDGTTWTAIPGSTQVLNLGQPLLAGFGITSHDQGAGSAVTLRDVAVNAGEIPPG